MSSDFEDHCWKDVIPPDVVEVYTHYARKTFVGPAPALVAIYAHQAIEPTKRLFAAARVAGLPIFYSTSDVRPESLPHNINATRRRSVPKDPAVYAIRAEFKPQPGDVVITKQRASAFFGTPLIAHLTQLGIRSIIMCGESTSGCVRASAVDAYSHGFHVTLVEECCFDRSPLSHKVNLFDLHHKYADVMTIDEVVAHLDGLKVRKAS
jgi:maleamate amidohydrolase